MVAPRSVIAYYSRTGFHAAVIMGEEDKDEHSPDQQPRPSSEDLTLTASGSGGPGDVRPREPATMPAIAGYRLLRVLGQGGMGTVYLADDETLGRRVAIKLVSERSVAQPETRARFLREARTMATVEHPHAVRVYSFGELQGHAYLVMEYVEGEDLANYLSQHGPLPVKESLRILRQTVEALEAAWEKGIVHRDIKPSNILLDRRTEVRVGDFGLAKPVHASADHSLTHGAYLLGTPHYMSPEQAVSDKVDFRSDIYSLGVVFYEMLTGERPFEGPTPLAVVQKHLSEPLPSPSEKRPDLPAGCSQLVQWMTRKNPGERPESFRQILEAVEALLADKPPTIATQPAPKKQKPAMRTPLRPVLARAAAGLLLLLAVGWAVWRLWGLGGPAPPPAAPGRLVVAVTPFYGPDEDSAKEGRVMAALVEKAIDERLAKYDVKLLGVDETRQPVRDHAAARTLGERLGATVVVWGEAFALRGETEIQPYFTMVPVKELASEGGRQPAGRRPGSLAGPLSPTQERSAAATTVQAAAPNQIEMRKTSAAGVGDMVLLLAGIHALYRENSASKAVQFFEAAPRTAESLRYRAEALLALGKRDDARKALRDSVSLDPRNAQAQAMLGDLLLEDGLVAEAAATYESAARVGGTFRTRNGISYKGKLYARDRVATQEGAAIPGAAASLYMVGIDSRTDTITERYFLPDVPRGFSLQGDSIRIDFQSGPAAEDFIFFSDGKFDRPVWIPSNYLVRTDSMGGQSILGVNFVSFLSPMIARGEEPTAFPLEVPGRAEYPKTIAQLEQAARQAAQRDPTNPWNVYLLGQALWAQGQRPQAEQTWERLFTGAFPATPYYEFAWMAWSFENLGQRRWADRAYEKALKRRKQLPQPVEATFLIDRLMSAPFFSGSRPIRRTEVDLDRAYVWLERTRQLTGLCPEIDQFVSAAWERVYRERGAGDRAAKEAEVVRRVSRHAANYTARLILFESALYGLVAASLGLVAVVLSGFLRAVCRCRASVPVPGAATPEPATTTGGRWHRLVLLGGGVIVLLGASATYFGNAAYGQSSAGVIGPPLLALGLLVIGGALLHQRLASGSRTFPSPVRLIAAIARPERAAAVVAFAVTASCLIVTLGEFQRGLAVLSFPWGLNDAMGQPGVVRQTEEWLKAHDTAQRRFVAATVNHMVGNTKRARELYESTGGDERVQKNLAALKRGEVAPPIVPTWEDFYRASLDTSWKEALQRLSRILEPKLREQWVLLILGVFVLLVFLAGFALPMAFRFIPPSASDLPISRSAGLISRIGWWLLPGWYDLQLRSVWRGYVTFILFALVLLAGTSHLLAVKLADTPAPGFLSGQTVPNYSRFLPTDKPPTIPDFYWSIFWAYPYARIYWPLVLLAAGLCLALHLSRIPQFLGEGKEQVSAARA